jgi:hypothetical protein
MFWIIGILAVIVIIQSILLVMLRKSAKKLVMLFHNCMLLFLDFGEKEGYDFRITNIETGKPELHYNKKEEKNEPNN